MSTEVNDFSFLSKMQPYDGDESISFSCIDIDGEIAALQNEMGAMVTEGINWDKWDYAVAFLLGIMEVAADFMFSDHNQPNSIANQMSDKKTPLGKAFHDIHKHKLIHKGHPLDYQGEGFKGGDHRAKTFGHDLLQFPRALNMLMKGEFSDSIYQNGAYQLVQTTLNQFGKEYAKLGFNEALIAYFTHMTADFFSNKGLPIPGFSLLTHFPNEKIIDFANDLSANGLNLRNLVMQGIPVLTVELVSWIYTSLRYRDSGYSKEQIASKKNTMLFLSHGIATAVNIGKVVVNATITKDFAKSLTSLNFPLVLRTVKLAWKHIKTQVNYTNKQIEKVYTSTLIAQLEAEKTLIILGDCLYYTMNIDRLIAKQKVQFDTINNRRIFQQQAISSELQQLMDELKRTNGDSNDE